MVTLKAAVAPQSGALPAGVHFGGSITLLISGRSPVTLPLGEDGTAEYWLPAQAPGEIQILAAYTGDGNYNGSSGEPVKLVTALLKTFLPFVGR